MTFLDLFFNRLRYAMCGTTPGLLGFPIMGMNLVSAKGDGVTDDTAAIQADINGLPASGGVLFFPPGVYKVTAPLVINRSSITIQGSGQGTVFAAHGDYGHVFDCRPDVDPVVALAFTDLQLFNFQIQSDVKRTSGSAIHTKWTHAATFRDLRIGTLEVNAGGSVFFWDGITLENESAAVIENCQINARHYGTYFSGTKVAATDYLGTNYWNGLITGNCNIWGDHANIPAGSAGVFIAGGTGGIQIEQCGISAYENGVHATGANRELFIGHAFAADDISGHGILIDANSVLILQMTGAWAAGCGRGIGGDGVHIGDSTQQLMTTITGGTFYSNAGYGIYIGQGQAMISGCTFASNPNGAIAFGVNATGSCVTGTSAFSIIKLGGATLKLRGNLGVADAG